jgi:hypothetical protein
MNSLINSFSAKRTAAGDGVWVGVIVSVDVIGADTGVPVNLASKVATISVPLGSAVCVGVPVGVDVRVTVFSAMVVLTEVGVGVRVGRRVGVKVG